MYLSFGSGEHGHATSAWPSASGIPTECKHFVNSPSPIASIAFFPMRVMIFILTTTYGESESWTPNCEIGEPSGPMQKGMAYIVRPRIEPLNFGVKIPFISVGFIQLFVGPASPRLREQMYVRSSTRATSDGCERARKLFGRLSEFSLMNVPASTIS